MKTFTKIIFTIIFMLSVISSSSIEEEVIDETVVANVPQIIKLKNETNILLKDASKPNTRIYVELIFTHPSNYNISLYQSAEEEDEDDELNDVYSVYSNEEPLLFENAKNGNKLYLDKHLVKKFIYPLRKLATVDDFNCTLLEDNLGKKKLLLDLGEYLTTPLILKVLRKEEGNDEKMYINYYQNEFDTINLKDTKVDVKQNKDMLNITFKGIQLKNDEDKSDNEDSENEIDSKIFVGLSSSLEDISVEYTINLFDKKDLESNYENIYAYKIDNKVKSLYTKNIKLKGNNVKQDIYLVIQAPLNEKKDQLLLVDADVNEGEKKISLQYELLEFKVEEESPERVWPEDDDDSDKTESDKTESDKTESDKIDSDKTGSDGTDKTEDDKDEDNKEKNKNKLLIIMVCFGISILLTLLVILIYIKYFSSREGKIEEEKDYKDVGGIVINDDEKNDGPATKEDSVKKINEEEE